MKKPKRSDHKCASTCSIYFGRRYDDKLGP